MLRELFAVLRLDLAEVVRSRWLTFAATIYALLAATFVFVGMRESALMEFTGMSRVMLAFCHTLVYLLPLLGLTATGQVINQSRDDGTLELLLSHPIRRSSYFVGVSVVRFGSLLVPLVALLAGMSLLGRLAFGQPIDWGYLLRALAVCSALLWAFVGLGLLISTWIRNQARAVVVVLLCWALAVFVMDFGLVGLMLRWRLNPQAVFVLASVNPAHSARLALLSAVQPELSIFGPVGFYLANKLGAQALLALGIAWPATFGLLAWSLALASFRKGDVI